MNEKNETIAKMNEKINQLENSNQEYLQENTKYKARLETLNIQLKSFDGKP